MAARALILSALLAGAASGAELIARASATIEAPASIAWSDGRLRTVSTRHALIGTVQTDDGPVMVVEFE